MLLKFALLSPVKKCCDHCRILTDRIQSILEKSGPVYLRTGNKIQLLSGNNKVTVSEI